MALNYATITGAIHFPGSTAGVKCVVTAVPLVQGTGLTSTDALLFGVVSKTTDAAGALPTGDDALKIPLTGAPVVWQLFADPVDAQRGGPGNVALKRWNFFTGPITATTTLQALAATVPTVLPGDLQGNILEQIQAAVDEATAAATAAEAARDEAAAITDPLTAPANTQVASYVTNDGATKTALLASFAQIIDYTGSVGAARPSSVGLVIWRDWPSQPTNALEGDWVEIA